MSELENIYSKLQNYNPTAKNYWSTYKSPFSASDKFGTLNQYTDLASKKVGRLGASNVNRATSGAAKRMLAGGYGGSVAEDIISGAGENASADTTNALENVQLGRLKEIPGIMNTTNQEEFNITGQKQNVDLQNIMNMLQKFGMSGGLADKIDNSPGWLDDILGVLNTGANVASKFIKPV